MRRPAVPYRLVLATTVALLLASPAGAQRTGQVTRPTPAVRTPPPAPTNVRVEQTPEGQVRVSWDAVPGAKSYFVGRAVGLGGFQRVADGTVGEPSYLDRAVQAGVKHVYLVSAIDSSGLAGARTRSDSIVPRTAAPRTTTPQPPTNLRAHRVGANAVELDWNGELFKSFQVRFSRDGAPMATLATVQSTRYMAANLAPGRYVFEVAASSAGAWSPPARTNPVEIGGGGATDSAGAGGGAGTGGTGGTGGPTTGTSTSARLAAPADLRVQQNASGDIVFSWDPVRGAKHYAVERTIGLVDPRGGGKNSWSTTTASTQVSEKRVQPGERYVYRVAAVDSSDRRGATATATEFTPRDTMEFDRPAAATRVEARATADDAISLRWQSDNRKPSATNPRPAPAYFEIAHVENDAPPRVLGTPDRPEATVPGLRPGRHQFVVTAIAGGKRSDPARSNVVVLPRDGATTDGSAAAPPDAQVVVTKGEPIVLRIGATHSLATLGQTGWTSLATGVATVSGTAVVTARAAGDTQLVRVVPDAGNVVRVTVVSVRVTP